MKLIKEGRTDKNILYFLKNQKTLLMSIDIFDTSIQLDKRLLLLTLSSMLHIGIFCIKNFR